MEKIGHYSVVGELGRGAMGVVLHCVDTVIGRPVAIKVINLQGEAYADGAAADQARGSLLNEARSAGRLSHPAIVTIYHVGQERDFSYIVMEFVDGPSLQSLLQTPGVLGRDQIVSIVAETAGALDYAHSMSVVHRDVKPANVMLNRRGHVKVCDFGIAKIYTDTATTTGMLKGTPHYMSPEQIQGGRADARSDQYALAVLTYEMVTGKRPFVADSIHTLLFRIISSPAVSAHLVNPSLPQAVSVVLERAMSKQPELRYPSCREFAQALSEAWTPAQKRAQKPVARPEAATPAKTPVSAPVVTPAPPPLRPSTLVQPAKPKAWPARVFAVVAGVLAVSISGVFFYRMSQREERPQREATAQVQLASPAQRQPELPPPSVVRTEPPPAVTPPASPPPRTEAPKVVQIAPEVAAWDSARRSDTLEDYRRYLRDFPAGPNAAYARRAVAEFEGWAAVTTSPNPDALNRFLAAYPGGRFSGTAESMLKRFAQEANQKTRELEGWSAIRASTNPEDFRQYARNFPKSAFVRDAADRAAALDAARQAQQQQQRPPVQPPPTAAPQPAVARAPEPPPPDPAALRAAARAVSAEAQKYLQTGRLEQAAAAYGKAASLDPAFWEAHAEQGKVYLKLGDFRAAVESFNRAISLRSSDANLLNMRGYAYYNLTQHSRAIVDYSEAIRLKPDFSEAYLNRGNSKWALGDRTAAEADFKMSRALRGRR